MDLKTHSPLRGLLFPLALALVVSTTALAQNAPPPVGAAPSPELQAAQARLEAAAKEVAELSAKAGGGAPRIQMRIRREGGPEQRDIEIVTQGPGGPGGMSGPGGMGQMGGMGPMGPMHRMAALRAGLRLAPLSPRLAGYFGAKSGVLVIKAENPALKLQDGDVITAIGGRTPASPMQAMRIFRSYEPGEKLALQLLRDHKPLTVEVTVPPRPELRRFELRREGPMPPAGGPQGGPQGGPPPPPHQH